MTHIRPCPAIFTDQKFLCILMHIVDVWDVKDLVSQVNGISTTFSAISWAFQGYIIVRLPF